MPESPDPSTQLLASPLSLTVPEFTVFVKRWVAGAQMTRCVHSKHANDCLSCAVHRAWLAGRASGEEEATDA